MLSTNFQGMILLANKELLKKLQVFLIIISLIFGALIARIFYLQIIKAEDFETLSEKNKLRIVSLPARRGDIYDRNMEVLATSKPVFTVAIASTQITEKEEVARKLSEILNDPKITQESILESIKKHYRVYEPLIIKRLPYEEGIQMVSRIEERREEMPGVIIQEEPMRYYPYGQMAGHILGTVGLINKDELDILETYNYSMNDWIGKTGLERVFERYQDKNGEVGLRGKRGVDQVEVTAKHRPVRIWSHKNPVPGNSLVLTLDANLQEVMESTMLEVLEKVKESREAQRLPAKVQAGAAVLMDVKTGAVLAMASAPMMDPNDFSNGLSKDQAAYYWDKDLKPTFSRTISGTYPPGSTFKPVTGIAALATGKVTPETTVTCTPSAWSGGRAKCWKVHGTVNLYSAMAGSCNTYFQEVASMAGVDTLDHVAEELGLGEKTGIELSGEAEGILPTPAWKEETFKNNQWEKVWRPYDTWFMSMGQGYNLYTPIQLANYMSTVANGGKKMKPYLVDKIVSSDGEILHQFEPEVKNEVSASPEILAEVRKSMRAVMEPGGTASSLFRSFPPEIKVAGKTGTAQTGLPGDNKDTDYHGVFVAFAPYDDPQVAFAGIIEYGYHGGTSAGLVAKAVFEEYFGLIKEPIPDELPEGME